MILDSKMTIDKELFGIFIEQAKSSHRLRYGMDMRTTPEDQDQRLLNAQELGTVIPIHRHQDTTETAVILRGRLRWMYYDKQGNLIDNYLLDAEGDIRGISNPKGQWHSIECLESGTVIFESKNGSWMPLREEDIMQR